MKEYKEAKAASPEIAQWQDPETGFEEWVADKVASFLFNEQAGKLLKATNLAESLKTWFNNRISRLGN